MKRGGAACARAEDKPIFSPSLQQCHWCHVMEHERLLRTKRPPLMNDLVTSSLSNARTA
ncbi:MAG: DUF255 domain-containing protein [Caldilineaceae bacterium]|nr:DUF255 domain-containing protein [Caldilineaceae bacterium]